MRRDLWWKSSLLIAGWMLWGGSIRVLAGESYPAPTSSSKEFERMKTLVGVWKGTSGSGDTQEPVTVDYRLTSGGSALVETLFPGTTHEMVSVYHDRSGKLSMTHYCLLGNQPELDLSDAATDHLAFTLAEHNPAELASSPHMHALTIHFTDADHMTQTWTGFEQGHPKDTKIFSLARAH